MISDEPDEDADTRDDESALEAYLGDASAAPNGDAKTTPRLSDWPPKAARDIGLNLDIETLAWFQATHADWRHAMRAVLRAWAAVKATQCAASQTPPPDPSVIAESADRP
jgi:hypothetical protein